MRDGASLHRAHSSPTIVYHYPAGICTVPEPDPDTLANARAGVSRATAKVS
jgi:hypothetical protein